MEHAIQSLSSALQSGSDGSLNPISTREWAATMTPFVEMRALHPRSEGQGNEVAVHRRASIAGLQFATGCELFTHGNRQIAASSELICVQRVASGYTALEFELKSFIHKPGYLTLVDCRHWFRGSHHNTVGEMLFIPRSQLGLDDGAIEPIMISEESAHGKLLAAEMNLFFGLSEDNATTVGFDTEPLFHLVNSVICQYRHPNSERAGWWRARNELIHKYIESNLGDVTLLPAQICNMFNLSRATLYRMFEADGGVRRYIQDRRLHAAVWDLADHGTQRGRLTEVSEKWGFSSNANFNRAVKTAFGMPPGSLLGPQSMVVPSRFAPDSAAAQLQAWVATVGDGDRQTAAYAGAMKMRAR